MSIEEENQRRRFLMSEAAKKINADKIRSQIQREAYNKNEMAHTLSEALRRGEFNKSLDHNEVKKKLCIHKCMLEEERKYPGNIDKVNSDFLKSALCRGPVSSDSTLGAIGGIKRRSQKKRKLRKSRRSIKKIKRKKNKRPTKKRR